MLKQNNEITSLIRAKLDKCKILECFANPVYYLLSTPILLYEELTLAHERKKRTIKMIELRRKWTVIYQIKFRY